jgi:hypothetical protein
MTRLSQHPMTIARGLWPFSAKVRNQDRLSAKVVARQPW